MAIRSFMDTHAKGQLGGIECTTEARERMARDSPEWKCAACDKTNADIMRETDNLVNEIEANQGKRKEEEIPDELRLAYRDELANGDDQEAAPQVDKAKARAVESSSPGPSSPQLSAPTAPPPPPLAAKSTATPPSTLAPRPTRTAQTIPVQQLAQRGPDGSLAWIDTCIYGIVAALLFMVIKKLV